MFILHILVYVIFALVMSNYAKISVVRNPANEHIDKYLWGGILFFTVISAIRGGVGGDSLSYITIFKYGIVREDSDEFLWDWLVRFVYDWKLHFVIGSAIIAFLQIFLLTNSLKKYKYILVWLPIVLFGGRYFLDLMGAVRQMLAACGFIFLLKYVIDRRPLPFTLGILLLSGFHHSVLLLLPTYFLSYVPLDKIKLSDKRVICLSIFFICFVLGQTPSFQGLLNNIVNIVSFSGYENYSDFYANVIMGRTNESLSLGPIMLSFLFSSAAVIWYAPKLHKAYSSKIPYFNLWYFFSYIYSCMFFLVCNMSHMMIRPFQYLELFLAIMLALLLHFFHNNMARYQYHFYALILVIWTCTIIGVYKVSGQPVESVIYKTFF